MSKLRSFFYTFRLAAGWFFWIPLLVVLVLATVAYLSWRDIGTTDQGLLGALEIWLPMLSGIMVSPLMAFEKETGFYELRQSYPESPLQLPLQRALLGFLYVVIVAIIAYIAFAITYNQLDLSLDFRLLVLAVPPALYAMSLSLLLGTLSSSSFIPGAIIVAYVLFDFQTGGMFTGPLYLMNGFSSNGTDLFLNRALLVIASLGLVAVNSAIHLYRKDITRYHAHV